MVNKLEASIGIIVHATEDISKFLDSFKEMFGISKEDFKIENLTGHYENPIIVLSLKISKKQARDFLNKLLKLLSKNQLNEILSDLDSRIERSTLYIRLGKQELIKGKIRFQEKNSIKLKISTDIYNKKNTHEIFNEILRISN